jgi:hypothetical protein
MPKSTLAFGFHVLSKSFSTVNRITVQYAADGLLHRHIFYDTASGSLALRGLLELINAQPTVYTKLDIHTDKVPA